MANEKRLIDANALIDKVEGIDWYHIGRMGYLVRGANSKDHTPMYKADDIYEAIMDAPTVDAVEANEYEALVGMYHDLRENFIDYVCSGSPNVAEYCLNRCEDCITEYGWCKKDSIVCRGFNPAEVILDRYAKMDGGNEDV